MAGAEWFKAIGLAFLGQALQKASALSDMATYARRCLLATVISGVLCAAFLLLCCFGFYRFLVAEGLSVDTAITLMAGLMLVLALISGLIAERYATRAKHTKEKLAPSVRAAFHPPLDAEKIFQAFMEGWFKAEQQPKESTEQEHYPTSGNL